MQKEIVRGDWYDSLIDDCQGIVTEAVFNSRWTLVEGYWQLGRRINEDKEFMRHARGNRELMTQLATAIKVSDRTLYYAVQFHRKFPVLNTVPEGKNVSWHKLTKQYLPAPKDNEEECLKHQWLTVQVCAKCHHRKKD